MVSARTGEGMDHLRRSWATGSGSATGWWSWSFPGTRGDVLAAVHREGEIVGEVHGEGSTRVQVVLDTSAGPRFAEFLGS